MTSITELQIGKTDYAAVNEQVIERVLGDGEVLLAIDKFALTANNVGYAVSGDFIGYWGYYPTNDQAWGNLCVWGIGVVEQSNHAELAVGERIYGFFPMASHAVMQPGKLTPRGYLDMAPHRQQLPDLYNYYSRTINEPKELQALENERSVLFPLFMTGYVISDFLLDHNWFDAEQIIVGSASSKTGFALGAFIKAMGYSGKVVGLTSKPNQHFVTSLGFFDETILYDEASSVSQISSVYVDMSGDAKVRAVLHNHLQDNMVNSQIVGATHWQAMGGAKDLPGASPTFFFTPAQVGKRDQEWGRGVLMQKGYAASAELCLQLQDVLSFEHYRGVGQVTDAWQALLDNRVSGRVGMLCAL